MLLNALIENLLCQVFCKPQRINQILRMKQLIGKGIVVLSIYLSLVSAPSLLSRFINLRS